MQHTLARSTLARRTQRTDGPGERKAPDSWLHKELQEPTQHSPQRPRSWSDRGRRLRRPGPVSVLRAQHNKPEPGSPPLILGEVEQPSTFTEEAQGRGPPAVKGALKDLGGNACALGWHPRTGMAAAEEEVVEEQPWVPTEDDISDALSGLAKTEDGTSVVFTKLALPGKEGRRLASLQLPITMLENVRHLDISGNRFTTDISEAVGQMEHLLSLKASASGLSAFVSDGTPFSYLQTIDLSKNQLTAWPGVKSPHLRYLNLCDNEIGSVTGLEQNPELQTLLLANNKPLTSCDGLGLSTLRELTLTDCGIESLIGLSTLTISSLDLSNNALKDLNGLATSGVLKKLLLDGNPIDSVDAVDALADVGLTELTLPEIPEAPSDMRAQVIRKLSQKGKDAISLWSLNGVAITTDEIELAFPPPADPEHEPPSE